MRYMVVFLSFLNGILTPLLFISGFVFLYRLFAMKKNPGRYTKDVPPEAVNQWLALMRRQANLFVWVGFGWFFLKLFFVDSKPPIEEIVFLIPFAGVVYAALCGSRAARVRKNPQLVFIKKANNAVESASFESPPSPNKVMIERISVYLLALPLLFASVEGLTKPDPTGIILPGEIFGRLLGAVILGGLIYVFALGVKRIFKLRRLATGFLTGFVIFDILFVFIRFVGPRAEANFHQITLRAAFSEAALTTRSLGDTDVSIRAAREFQLNEENEMVKVFLSGANTDPLVCIIFVTKPEWIKANSSKRERRAFLEKLHQEYVRKFNGDEKSPAFSGKEVNIGGINWIRSDGPGMIAGIEKPGMMTSLYCVSSARDVFVFMFVADDAPQVVQAAKEAMLASIKI